MPTSVDYRYWAQLAGWTTAEAAALFLNEDPDSLIITGDQQPNTIGWRYLRMHRLLQRAVEMDELSTPSSPEDMLEWAKRNNVEVPEQVIESVRPRPPFRSWRARFRSMRKQRNRLAEERDDLREQLASATEPLDARRRKTYQRLILGMARAKFGYDSGTDRSAAIGKIQAALGHDLSVSDDTIRIALFEAARDLNA